MTESDKESLWKLLWDYDPNGLIAVDWDMNICVVNPALCQMFNVTAEQIIGKPASVILQDAVELEQMWKGQEKLEPRERAYPRLGLYVRQVLFRIEHQRILGCIMVNLTEEWRQKRDLARVRHETLTRIDEVITNQMRVAQQIASLLGETTAESKSSLLKLIQIIKQEPGDLPSEDLPGYLAREPQ